LHIKGKNLRVNETIRAREVRLIDPEGEQIGIVPIDQARSKATEAGLDLVEVAPDAKPPVCKIFDYRKLQYDRKRRDREARKRRRHVELKEVKMRPRIDEHDYQTKLRHIREFLEGGHKVKVTIMFRGREMAHREQGRTILERVAKDVSGVGTMDDRISQMGRQQHMILSPDAQKQESKEKEEQASS
jgi:translation initiation factor IF-3